MSEKITKKILLEQAMTWAGVNYAPGVNTMPEKGANYAARKKFGKIIGGDGNDVDFDLLPLADTVKRFGDGDTSEVVLKSIAFHQSLAAEAAERMSVGGNRILGAGNGDGDGDGDGKGVQGNENNGLPEDFPMKHVFEAPNKHSETGFKTVEEIQKFSREQLIEIDGIGATSADKALAYGK